MQCITNYSNSNTISRSYSNTNTTKFNKSLYLSLCDHHQFIIEDTSLYCIVCFQFIIGFVVHIWFRDGQNYYYVDLDFIRPEPSPPIQNKNWPPFAVCISFILSIFDFFQVNSFYKDFSIMSISSKTVNAVFSSLTPSRNNKEGTI